ncbi:hypothetical protein G9E11_12200 [Arthrobacter sp. IA7]|uniref:hypothetical protein n=1 Tax=Arthrobacter ipis TaxID=2716202 RepID=UPI001686982F|nr:hypothetical protein [Arthrobacter ipis]MBD1542993.1 hypothetical protein [Arthrobacter ipis]
MAFTPIEKSAYWRDRLNDKTDPRAERIRWYLLIRDTEKLAEETGLGLGGVWGYIHEGDYEAARDLLDLMIETES